ncbi:hypothetical protein PHYPSEUDO_002191 [Phytophthora pseudosyringae]|uniref:Uncharacterized protein n=1 Tax=Phytophthora pseudosyringae TaxID=221518 RepID=A0A8T1VTY9_9STRA|nr:hypothetical protein PHYPSEUDO_002191 [Phytophthora pseudosyringae]
MSLSAKAWWLRFQMRRTLAVAGGCSLVPKWDGHAPVTVSEACAGAGRTDYRRISGVSTEAEKSAACHRSRYHVVRGSFAPVWRSGLAQVKTEGCTRRFLALAPADCNAVRRRSRVATPCSTSLCGGGKDPPLTPMQSRALLLANASVYRQELLDSKSGDPTVDETGYGRPRFNLWLVLPLTVGFLITVAIGWM